MGRLFVPVVCGHLVSGMQEADHTPTFYYDRGIERPTYRTWLVHSFLLALTFVTSTIAGSLYPFGPIPIMPEADPRTLEEALRFLFDLPVLYIALISGVIHSLATDWQFLKNGLSFSLSLLFILSSHEMGHYVACRIYRVEATLPFFIPTPPMIGPAGTFGAFIKIKSAMPSRKAVFDIGVSGPIAGFIALIPIAVIGVLSAVPAPTPAAGFSGIVFSDPLFTQALAWVAGVDLANSFGNAFYFAAWIGLLVTALNLIPSGQLDGGHAIYAIFGERVHYWTGRIAFLLMALLSVLGLVYFNSPSGFLIAVLLAIMMRIGHPRPWDEGDIGTGRKMVAAGVLLIFLVSFLPFPIRVFY